MKRISCLPNSESNRGSSGKTFEHEGWLKELLAKQAALNAALYLERRAADRAAGGGQPRVRQ
jgi:hypothetical protein